MSRPSDAARALACALLLAAQAGAFAAQDALRWTKVSMPPATPGRLVELREDAQFGDPQARSALTERLLDRFEVTHDGADLREALQWIARDPQPQALRLVTANRMLADYCARRALRGMWVCEGAD